MHIWIDLANSPQVLFFRPLIPVFRQMGHRVTITSRWYAQTVALANDLGLPHTPVGGHGGTKIGRIGSAILERAWALTRFANPKQFDLAISHNSYAQALAARALNIPFVTSMDYEHQPANHLSFRLARHVVVPMFFPAKDLHRYGAPPRKVSRYAGTKEEIYLSDFEPDPGYLKKIDIDPNRVIIVMRPPGTWTLYHHFENPLFTRVLEFFARDQNTTIIFLPRILKQAEAVTALKHGNIVIPGSSLDGPNLMHHADIVVGGGGSMNREAAVLGANTFSLYAGRLAAVDRYLIRKGLMTHIRSIDDIKGITICKTPGKATNKRRPELIQQTAKAFLSGRKR